MKFYVNNPAFLQGAGNHAKGINWFYVESLEDENEFSFAGTYLGQVASQMEYSLDAITWNQLSIDYSLTINNGEKLYLRCVEDNIATGERSDNGQNGSFNLFCPSGAYKIGGDLSTLIFKDGIVVASEAYCGCLFNGQTYLSSAEDLVLPNVISEWCFDGMFNNCRNMSTPPNLPFTELAEGCYSAMFNGCESLEKSPELPAIKLFDYCYGSMFQFCRSLTNIICLAEHFALESTSYWTYEVAQLGTFTKAAGVEWPTASSGIPDGWTVIEV